VVGAARLAAGPNRDNHPRFVAEPQKSLPTHIDELRQLVVDYAKQETVEPLKGLARFVAFGVAGSLALGIGLVLLAVAGLRALQTETGGHLTGSLTWLPYAIVLAGTLLVIALAASRIGKGRR
jgi:Putative Actinobacterial Holin-X, holin superfamily III